MADRKVGISLILKDKMSGALQKASGAAGKLREKGKQIEAAFKQAAKHIAIFATAVAAAGVAAFMLTKKVAESGDAMIKGAQRLNLTTDAYQRLDFAMQISGTSMEQQRGSITRFARTARDAGDGVKIAEQAFETLGVKVKTAGGQFRGTEELFLEVAQNFSTMPPSIEKTALMMDLFGRSGAQMAQLLNLGTEGISALGKEAEHFGGVLEEAALKRSEEFIDAMTRMDTAMGSVTNNIGDDFQPMFTRSMNSVAESTMSLKKAFTPVFKSLMKGLKETSVVAVPVLVFLGKAFIGFGTVVALAWKTITLSINTFLAGIVMKVNGFISIVNMVGKHFGMAIEPVGNIFADTVQEIAGEMGDITEASATSMKALDDLGDAVLGIEKKSGKAADSLNNQTKAANRLKGGVVELTAAQLKAIADLEAARAKRKKEAEQGVEDLMAEQAEYRLKMQIKMTNELAEAEQLRMQTKIEQWEENKAKAEEMANVMAKSGDRIGQAFVSGFGAAEEGTDKLAAGMKAAGEATIMTALDTMQQVVVARAAEAAAGAASATAAVPFIGPMLAAAAAGAMFALVKGFIALGFSGGAEGGLVKGGIPGKDSVPLMLMPGELVVPKNEVDAGNGNGNGRNGSEGPSITLEMSTTIPPSRAEMKRYLRKNVIPVLRELKSQGMG